MRTWLLTAPRWVLVVLTGGFFATFTTGWSHLGQGVPWAGSVVSGALGGLFFGVVFGWWLHRQNARTRERMGGLPARDVLAAAKAARRGVVPADPEVRAAALGVVEGQLALVRGQRVLQGVLWPVVIAMAIWLALTSSPWWWLAVPYFGGFLVLALVTPRRLEQQVRVLRGEPQLS